MKKAAPPIVEHFERFSRSYDRVNHLLSLGLDVRWRGRLIDAVGEGLPKEPCRILDLCAGTLACTREALRRFPEARITAVDISRAMLDSGLSNLTETERMRLEVVCADVLAPRFGPASFDAAICSFGMRHLPGQARLLEKVHGWLAPGGRLVVFDFFRPNRPIARLFQCTAGKFFLPLAGEWLGGFGPAYVNLHESIRRFLSRAEFEQLLSGCGFLVRRSEDWTFGIVSMILSEPS